MSEIIRPFNIMAKPVCGLCNLDCRYCYYTMKPRELYPGVRDFRMTEETLETYTRQYMDAMPVRVEFGWQGGEPLLRGKEFFRKAIELQKQFTREGQTVSNAMQTNGTLLDDEWCELFAENGFLVGISLDGPPQWHDAFRRDREDNPSFHRAWAGVELLRKHGVEYNVLVTLNSANAPHVGDIYRYFTNRGVQYLQFIPILERKGDTDEPTEFSCTSEHFARFMLEVFEQWASRDVGRVSERFIDNVLHSLIYGKASMCCYSDRCANAHVLEFNGDLYACDHFVYEEWKLGNIHDTPLAELVCSPRLEEFAALKLELPDLCRDCEYLDLCRGGCPKHHRPIGTSPERFNHFCEGYKMFFREALPELRRMAEYFRRGQMPPLRSAKGSGASATPASPTAPTATPPMPSAGRAAPGRNDPCPCGSGKKYKNCCGRK
jgi:serine-type anaerobic sulfatase-maturating enzyme